jgi:long-chain fatty acid transport protein
MRITINRYFSVIALLAVLYVPQAEAGGFFGYEMGTPNTGLAAAGFSARAEDASTLFSNPAGMTRLNGSNLLLGAQVINGHVEFKPDADTGPQTGSDGGNAVDGFPEGASSTPGR